MLWISGVGRKKSEGGALNAKIGNASVTGRRAVEGSREEARRGWRTREERKGDFKFEI
jgi:hypothetical protein